MLTQTLANPLTGINPQVSGTIGADALLTALTIATINTAAAAAVVPVINLVIPKMVGIIHACTRD